MLSELEGAILTEIDLRGRNTAFQVRKAFQNSPTSDWSGSAGAVYPAIKRMTERGFVASLSENDARKTRRLSLTTQGKDALMAWATNAELAVTMNSDPFRTRIDYVLNLPIAQRDAVLNHIKLSLKDRLSEFSALIGSDHKDKSVSNSLALWSLQSKLDWIENQATELLRSDPE